MEIFVDNDRVSKESQKMLESAKTIEAEIKKILRTIDDIGSVWSGPDAEKYIEVMKEKYIVGLQNLNNVVQEYANYLNSVSSVYDLFDGIHSSKHISI